ncbi:MAG: anti-sigma factor family protein, partial [Planctomycetota bacterium]
MENACKNIQEQILELITGTLSADRKAELQQHIAACPDCSKYLQALQSDDRLLGDFVEVMQPTVAHLEQSVIDTLNRSTSDKAANFVSIWKAIVRSRVTRFAAAALIIIAALIGIKMLSGSDEQPSRKAVREDGVHNKEFVVEQAGGNLDVELEGIEQMFKAGNVDGLVAMLSEGEFGSKVAAA